MTKPLTPTELAACVADASVCMDTALARPEGVRLHFTTERAARQFRGKCLGRRNALRAQSKRVLVALDTEYGRSPWEPLSFYVAPLDKGGWSLHIRIDTPELLGITGSN